MPGVGVICDSCGDHAPPVAFSMLHGGERLRAAAREAGWLCDETGDWCPECRKQREEA